MRVALSRSLEHLFSLCIGDMDHKAKQLEYLTHPLVPQFVAELKCGNEGLRKTALKKLRKLLSLPLGKAPIQQVIDCGAVPRLVDLLTFEDDPDVQLESAWCLTNIASGTSDQTASIVSNGAVPRLVELLENSQNLDVLEQSVWALGNIARDNDSYRDLVLSHNALSYIVDICQKRAIEDRPKLRIINLSLAKTASWSVSQICYGSPDSKSVRPALGLLKSLIKSEDSEVLGRTCWALKYLTDHISNIQAVLDSGISVHRLVDLLEHQRNDIKTCALNVVRNISAGNDTQTQKLLNHGVLRKLKALLSSIEELRSVACWIISNITAGSKPQIQAVMDAKMIRPLLQKLTQDTPKVRIEAAHAIVNLLVCGTEKQVREVTAQGLEAGIIKPLCEILDSSDSDSLTLALNCLEELLKGRGGSGVNKKCSEIVKGCAGFERIRSLANDHLDRAIANKASGVLKLCSS